MYNKMLVPLDGSELAEMVFPYVKQIAVRMSMNIVLLHVCSPTESESTPMHRAYVDRIAEVIKLEAQELQAKSGIRPWNKAIKVKGEVVARHSAEEILHYAEENDISFIVMATHGYSGISRWVYGSIADKVLHGALNPVFLVRTHYSDSD